VTKFFLDSLGNFYIGTNYSVFLLDPLRFSVRLLPNTEEDEVMNKIIKSQVVSMAESVFDGTRVLVAVPYGHYLAYYDFAGLHWVSRLDTTQRILERYQLSDNLIRKIHKARNGTLWMATAKQGLGEWKPAVNEPVRYYRNDPAIKNGFSNNNIYDIAEDNKGNLWLSTWGGGLHYFDTQTRWATHISGSSNLLEGVQTDSLGNVWMVSNGHLNKYDPVRKAHTTYLLPDVEKTGGVRGAIFKSKDGKLFVSGENYFIEFNPLNIQEETERPDVYFTDFRIFNESYSHLLTQNHIPLRYNQNYVTFEFSAPVYAGGTVVQYQYMLEGLRDDWVDLGVENKISFSNLDDGRYTFKVRASNRPGVWSEHIVSVQLEIIPPVWRRTWFYLACAALLSALIYALYRYRINELVKRQEIRNKIAQDLHDSIGSTLSSISVYSQVAKIYRQQQKEDQLKEALEKISETSGEMISEMNDIVWAINPRNDRMDVMLQRMESFAKPLLAARSIAFAFQYDEQVKSLNLDMTSRKNFYLIFKEAIHNVLKYSGCKNLHVSVQLREGRLLMRVRDDGAGFDTASVRQKTSASLSGNGLHNMRLRAKEMKGEVYIESEPGKGTTVTLDFPIP
jgi:signal transduction histidine kinase